MSPLVRIATLAVFAACNVDGPPPEPPKPAPAPYVIDEPDPAAVARAPAPLPNLEIAPGLEVRPAIRDGRMAIIPIVTTKPDATKYLTLQDGMRRGLVSVREMPTEWDVSTVMITNRSQLPLLVSTGEIIVDAHQDRATAEDTVIHAGATVEIDVRCVESDRDYGDNSFAPGNAFAELAIRKALLHGTQSQVWDEVDRINRERDVVADTKSYRHAAQRLATDANPRRDHIAAALASHEDRAKLVGFAVAVDGELVAMDHFASPQLYQEHEPRLVASYAVAAEGPVVEGRRVTLEAIRTLATEASAQTAASFTAIKH